jgi:hypothetical protein
MLAAITDQLAVALAAQGVPFPVVFGPESSEDLYSTTDRIVVQYDDDGDTFETPKGTHPNPRMPLVCWQGVQILIYARSNVSNAGWRDHSRLANQVRGHVLAELDYLVRARKNFIQYGAGRFVTPQDAAGSAVFGGAVYEIKLSIDRGIERRTWAGEARPTVKIGPGGVAVTSTTKASDEPGAAGTPPVDAETAC